MAATAHQTRVTILSTPPDKPDMTTTTTNRTPATAAKAPRPAAVRTALTDGEYDFRKQPVSPPPGSDSEVLSSDGREQPRPKSLLTSLLSDHSSPSKKQSATTTGGYTSGPSAPSSAPSTAFSSPRAADPVSILRRGSIGSDGEPFHLPFAAHVVPTSPTKSTVAGAASGVHVVDHAPTHHSALKFTVAQPRSESERVHVPLQQDDDDMYEGNDTDQGYEEDSEDGFSDDEPTFMMQAMARAREAKARASEQQVQLASRPAPLPATAMQSPPPRRGRGHIRVDPAVGLDHKSCTRHYSPPPTEARSSRSAPPGPRDGRAGSPVPSKHEDEDDDDDEEDEDEDGDDDDNEDNNNKKTDTAEGSQDDEAVAVVAPATADNDEAIASDASVEAAAPVSTVRNILRRASEHLPSFRRPSFALSPAHVDIAPAAAGPSGGATAEAVDIAAPGRSGDAPALSRARSLGAPSKPFGHPVSILSSGRSRAGARSGDETMMARSRPVTCPAPRRTDE